MGKVRFNRTEMQVEIAIGCGLYRVDMEQCADSA